MSDSNSAKSQQQQLLVQKLYKARRSGKHKTDAKSVTNENAANEELEKPERKGTSSTDDDLTKRAIAEICQDTVRAAQLAEEVGPSGWRAAKIRTTSKRFLSNTMRSVISHNKRTTIKNAIESRKKFDEIEKRKPKFGARTHSFQRPEERLTKKTADGL